MTEPARTIVRVKLPVALYDELRAEAARIAGDKDVRLPVSTVLDRLFRQAIERELDEIKGRPS